MKCKECEKELPATDWVLYNTTCKECKVKKG
jgi:hypothetical protein